MGWLQLFVLFIVAHSFAVCFLGAAIGGEETVIFLSMLSAYGSFPIWVVLLFCYLGILTSDTIFFFAGKIKFLSHLKRSKHIHFNYKRATGLIERFSKGKVWRALAFTKFLYGTRMFTLLYLGRRKTKFKEFIIPNIFIAAFWLLVVTGIGWLAGKGFAIIANTYKNIQLAVILAIGVLVLFLVLEIILGRFLGKEVYEVKEYKKKRN